MFPALRALGITVELTLEVLQEMGVFVDDRLPAFDRWLEAKLEGLAPGIRDDVEAWARALRDGAPRIKPRNIKSVWIQVNRLRPTLLHWSDRYGHLREVTREAATTPAARLVLMLAAVHAARTGAIRSLLLDDVDLGNRRLTIAGRTRPIDEFTDQILLEWLDYRRTRSEQPILTC
ncbi:hypothetical protein ACFPOI_16920 [Nonomuraea angiospora]|uniref:Integrase n=1 Tax=Nonomuraea angiospora TaxID=46172 RepID=A0ABR9MHD8_9ACTN|nr:hypothetical protein [Nonomuraea angiospora]MBE1592323.1 integrase [Nonomuraea angiospora]